MRLFLIFPNHYLNFYILLEFPMNIFSFYANIKKNYIYEKFAISIDNSIKSEVKPKVMRDLEGFLRKNIFKQVELIAERVQDVSPLRRLTKEDLRKEV